MPAVALTARVNNGVVDVDVVVDAVVFEVAEVRPSEPLELAGPPEGEERPSAWAPSLTWIHIFRETTPSFDAGSGLGWC
jgi:hypothetical protein